MDDFNNQTISGENNNQTLIHKSFILNKSLILRGSVFLPKIFQRILVAIKVLVCVCLILSSLLFIYKAGDYLIYALNYNILSLCALLFFITLTCFFVVGFLGVIQLFSKDKFQIEICVCLLVSFIFLGFGYYFAPYSVRNRLDIGSSSNNLLIKSKVEIENGIPVIHPIGKEYIEPKPKNIMDTLYQLYYYFNSSPSPKAEYLPLLYEQINEHDLTQFALNVVSRYNAQSFVVYVDAKVDTYLKSYEDYLEIEKESFEDSSEDSYKDYYERKQFAIVFPSCSTDIAAFGEFVDDCFKPHYFIEFANNYQSEIITHDTWFTSEEAYERKPLTGLDYFDSAIFDPLYDVHTKPYYIYQFTLNSFTFDNWKHNPARYNKQAIVISGNIKEIVENGSKKYLIVLSDKGEQYCVKDCRIDKSQQFFVGDEVSIYGICSSDDEVLSERSVQNILESV